MKWNPSARRREPALRSSSWRAKARHPRLRCAQQRKPWMPACAGMTRLGRPWVNAYAGQHITTCGRGSRTACCPSLLLRPMLESMHQDIDCLIPQVSADLAASPVAAARRAPQEFNLGNALLAPAIASLVLLPPIGKPVQPFGDLPQAVPHRLRRGSLGHTAKFICARTNLCKGAFRKRPPTEAAGQVGQLPVLGREHKPSRGRADSAQFFIDVGACRAFAGPLVSGCHSSTLPQNASRCYQSGVGAMRAERMRGPNV